MSGRVSHPLPPLFCAFGRSCTRRGVCSIVFILRRFPRHVVFAGIMLVAEVIKMIFYPESETSTY